MKIKKVTIKNFRILNDIELDLEENLSLIIGKNNCGKTSILHCLNKFLTSSNSSFTYDDFNLNFQRELEECLLDKKNWADIAEKGIEVYIQIEYDDQDDLSKVSKLMMDLDKDNHTVVLKMEYCMDDSSFILLKKNIKDECEINELKEDDIINKFMNQFLHKNHMKYFKVTYRAMYYDILKNTIDKTKTKIIEKRDVAQIISIKSIGARRDTINKENDSSLSYLTSKYYERIKGNDKLEAIREFENALASTDNSLSSIYKNLFSDIIKKVKIFGGINRNDTLLEIVSTLGQQELLKDNTTVVYNAGNQKLPESYNGLGYLNLISIIIQIETMLSEFRKDNEESRPADINLFFIEEPEAHTHPQMQYIFIKNIKALLKSGSDGSDDKNKINLQTIITTHSSHIVSESDFDDIKYLRKDKDNQIVSKNLKDLEIKYKNEYGDDGIQKFKFLKQYLTLNRAEIFFADKAILFEGDTERILLPAMMKKIDQEDDNGDLLPLKAQNISLLEVGNYSNIYDKFLQFIGIKTLIITDIDSCVGNKKGKPVLEGYTTSNSSLKYYYKHYLNDKDNELEVLKKLDSNQKILRYTNDSWLSDSEGKLMVTYQTNEKIEGVEYYPRSFEDAFIYCNRSFFSEKILNMENNLKNKEVYDNKFENQQILAENVYSIANKCIVGKASFAMDILLNSTSSEEKDFVNWNIPTYIKEGLEWLKK